MSLKFFKTHHVQSLKLVLKPSTKILAMANGEPSPSHGQVQLPMEINSQRSFAEPHLMNGLTYDLILGRDWCDANGVILDFNKKKLFFLKQQINRLDDIPRSAPTAYASLTEMIVLHPFCETPVQVISNINEKETFYLSSYQPMVERLGVFAVKGLIEFREKKAQIAITNFTKRSVILPKGTIVANLENFDVSQWNVHNDLYDKLEDKVSHKNSEFVQERSETQAYRRVHRDKTLKRAKPMKDVRKVTCCPDTRWVIDEEESEAKVRNWKVPQGDQRIVVDGNCRPIDILNFKVPNELAKVIHLEKRQLSMEEEDSEQEQTKIETLLSQTEERSQEFDKLIKELHIDISNLSAGEIKQIYDLLERKAEVFAKKDQPLTHIKDVTHKIDTGKEQPISSRKYRVAHNERPIIQELITDMLKKKLIEPSRSPWSSPIVLVRKKDGSIRFCCDYRRLNSLTIKDVYALPRIDDALASLNGNKFFSGLDCFQAYWQMPMDEESKAKTAFITDEGLFQWNVMPYGLCNAPASYQRFMDAILAGLKWNILICYVDDVVVFSKDFSSHLKDLETVFDRFLEANLQLKPSKCHLFQRQLVYLGHIISEKGISMDPKKIKAILEMPAPKDKKTVRSFLGMCGYYRAFIRNFAKKCAPLYKLTRDDVPYEWSTVEQESFDSLKLDFSREPILCHPNFNYPFIIESDSCDLGLGGILLQRYDGREHIIQYISRSLQPAELKWCVREKEALSILWACDMFRVYVSGTEFTVETDHASLKWLMEVEKPARLVRWALRLSEFNIKIQPKAGRTMTCADALSRLPLTTDTFAHDSEHMDEKLVNELLTIHNINMTGLEDNELIIEQKADPHLGVVYRACEQSNGSWNEYYVENNILMNTKGDVVVIPFLLREKILAQYHNSNLSGVHMAADKMIKIFKDRFTWSGMLADIKLWVNSCKNCTQHKRDQPKQHGLLQPIKSVHPFQIVGMDVAGPFKRSTYGSKYILVCIDYFTNWIEAIPLKTLSADETVKAFFKSIISRHGCPNKVITDNATNFKSELYKRLCETFKIEHIPSAAYHSQANGKSERFIRFLKNSLGTVINSSMTNWESMLDNVLFVYRVSYSRVLDDSPFFLLYGRDPTLPQDLVMGLKSKQKQFVDLDTYKLDLLKQLKLTYEKLRSDKELMQAKYKQRYDVTHKNKVFQIGDLVWVHSSLPKLGLTQKLLPRFEGPYEVIERLDQVTYRVQNETRTFPTHVQRMLPYYEWA
jgi:hypothetical protein